MALSSPDPASPPWLSPPQLLCRLPYGPLSSTGSVAPSPNLSHFPQSPPPRWPTHLRQPPTAATLPPWRGLDRWIRPPPAPGAASTDGSSRPWPLAWPQPSDSGCHRPLVRPQPPDPATPALGAEASLPIFPRAAVDCIPITDEPSLSLDRSAHSRGRPSRVLLRHGPVNYLARFFLPSLHRPQPVPIWLPHAPASMSSLPDSSFCCGLALPCRPASAPRRHAGGVRYSVLGRVVGRLWTCSSFLVSSHCKKCSAVWRRWTCIVVRRPWRCSLSTGILCFFLSIFFMPDDVPGALDKQYE